MESSAAVSARQPRNLKWRILILSDPLQLLRRWKDSAKKSTYDCCGEDVGPPRVDDGSRGDDEVFTPPDIRTMRSTSLVPGESGLPHGPEPELLQGLCHRGGDGGSASLLVQAMAVLSDIKASSTGCPLISRQGR